jgi:protein-disulfide isomerase
MARSSKSRRSRTEEQARHRAWRRWAWLLLIGGVLVVVVVAGYEATHLAQPSALSPSTTQTPTMAIAPSFGPASAPVTLIEYGDFGCTTCRAWEQAGVLKAARQEYGDKLHFVWRDFPVTPALALGASVTAESPKAAEAGRCANDQGKFWEYHDLLYQKAPALSAADLKTYAGQLGLDTTAFNQCLDSGQHKPTVDAETQAAFQLGFRGTPSFLLNGQPLVGPPTLAYLEQLINPRQ